MFDDNDDDERPVVFRRRDSASNKNQLGFLDKRSSASQPDKQQARLASGVNHASSSPSFSGANRNAAQSSVKALVPKPFGDIKKSPTTSSALRRDHPKKDSILELQESLCFDSDDSDDDMPLGSRRAYIPVNNGMSTNSGPSKKKAEASKFNVASSGCDPLRKDFDVKNESSRGDSDSDDDKPLSARIPGIPAKKMPLSTKFQVRSNGGLPSSNMYDSYGDKLLPLKRQQNGAGGEENQMAKTLMAHKRAATEAGSGPSGQSSLKRLKPSDASDRGRVNHVAIKSEPDDESDQVPISQRIKEAASANNSETLRLKQNKVVSSSFKVKQENKFKKFSKNSSYFKSSKFPPRSSEGKKWSTLSHNGVMFPPPYEPHGVKMLYDGKPVDLTPEQEEVATMYAAMLETDYVQKPKFNENFFNDWKKILGKNHIIQDLKKCDFTPIHQWHLIEKEKKKQMSLEEKKALKEEKSKQEEKYMWAILDGVKEKVGNFRVEPPGLFRGRGEHPKMGKLKKRIYPSDITINIGKEAPVPECHIPGERWKEVRHDNTVTWLAYWNDPINQKEFKYVFFAASSTLKGQSDKEKYEKARKLKDYIQNIRATYTRNFTIKDVATRQIAVATYLIDRLALRAGNEKDDDEADTVGCCTLKVENVKPIPPNILEFDFLGKDSIKYYKQFEADPLVFKAVTEFRRGKKDTDDLFDELDTSKLNAHLKDIMPGLTAKVFRTYNASSTLDIMLSRDEGEGDLTQKVLIYNQANKEVAIICNHQRSVSKNHASSMEKLNGKLNDEKHLLNQLEINLARAKKGLPPLKDADGKQRRNLAPEALKKKIAQTNAKIEKMELDMESREDMKQIALGTSRLNYCDPRITVAWCKRNEVPIEKFFGKTMQAKFAWAMDVDPSFRF
ncbi:DNA topoisomerase 1 alpha-like protein [Drosera capensis]